MIDPTMAYQIFDLFTAEFQIDATDSITGYERPTNNTLVVTFRSGREFEVVINELNDDPF